MPLVLIVDLSGASKKSFSSGKLQLPKKYFRYLRISRLSPHKEWWGSKDTYEFGAFQIFTN